MKINYSTARNKPNFGVLFVYPYTGSIILLLSHHAPVSVLYLFVCLFINALYLFNLIIISMVIGCTYS